MPKKEQTAVFAPFLVCREREMSQEGTAQLNLLYLHGDPAWLMSRCDISHADELLRPFLLITSPFPIDYFVLSHELIFSFS